MSLLDDEGEPFVDTGSHSYTQEPLYDDQGEEARGEEGHKSKEKKEKKKLDDRKSSTKAMPWSKSSAEKTPKKSKHHRTKSGSPPPVSPKIRGQEQKRPSKGTSSQVHPSPNVKSQRKRYVQLGVEAGSSSEGEVDLESEGGFLLSNQPVLTRQDDSDMLESLGTRLKISTETANPKQTIEPSFFDQETSEAHSDAWCPQAASSSITKPQASPRRTTFSPGTALGKKDIADAFLPHAERSLPASSNSLMGDISGFPPPQQQPSLFGRSTAVAPPGLAPPTQPWPSPSAQEQLSKEPDWTISNDLRQKCMQQFNDLNPMEGRLQGDKAREFFVQSKLPNQELSAIWRLSDTDKDNALSETEFCIAMKLVLMRRKGFDIPTSLPDSLQQEQHEQIVEKPVVQADRGKETTDTKTTTPVEQPELLHSDLSRSVPAKHEASDEILVEIGNQDSDTGLLVDVNEGGSPISSPPASEPAVARIISIDTSWEALEEDREDTALVSSSSLTKSDDDSSSPSRQKPARPAPPKPSPRRSKVVKERPGLVPRPSERKEGGGSSSPPPGLESEAQSLLIIDSRQKSKSVRVSSKSPGTSKKDYSILGESALNSEEQSEEKHGRSKVRWKSNVQDGELSGERGDKGHARSTSLDLNKMLLAGNISDVLEDLPSAEPPKPPPKPSSRASTASDHDDSTSPTKDDLIVPRARARALSTGSMDSSHTHEDPIAMETSADALLLSGSKPHPPPKPRKKAPLVPASKPQRPPPPKPSGGVDQQMITKDKAEVQAHIRSLKENNSALTEINGHLEDKLFKLIEERVRLAKQLKELQLVQQQQVDNQQQ